MRVFISHAGQDQAWAEWVAWQFKHYNNDIEVELDGWNWLAGDNFIARINTALENSDRMVALFSRAYFEPARWTSEEWMAAYSLKRPGFLVPVRIGDTPAPPILAGIITVSVFGKPEEVARQDLLSVVRLPESPLLEPNFPGQLLSGVPQDPPRGPRLPGILPEVWNTVPGRNSAFIGRDDLLHEIRCDLTESSRPDVQVLSGVGGVGKTQLAAEYLWRFASDYDAVWWVHAERPEAIAEQYAEFAVALALAEADDSIESAVGSLRRYCRTENRWIVVLDNATTALSIQDWLLLGPGHMLVTSRASIEFNQIAKLLSIPNFARDESVALLGSRISNISDDDADQISAVLGDLPLAVAQAASILGEGMQPNEYLRLLSHSLPKLLSEGRPLSYPVSLAVAIGIAMDQLTRTDPGAAQLLHLCSTLSSDPIPTRWFRDLDQERFPEPLASSSWDPLAFRSALRAISNLGIAQVQVGTDEIVMHQLTRKIIQSTLKAELEETAFMATHAIASSAPATYEDPLTWRTWAALARHLSESTTLVADGRSSNTTFDVVFKVSIFSALRGNWQQAAQLAKVLRTTNFGDTTLNEIFMEFCDSTASHMIDIAQTDELLIDALKKDFQEVALSSEPDEVKLIVLGSGLGYCYSLAGRHGEAREVHSGLLERCERRFGIQAPITRAFAVNLANNEICLGDSEAAVRIAASYHVQLQPEILMLPVEEWFADDE